MTTGRYPANVAKIEASEGRVLLRKIVGSLFGRFSVSALSNLSLIFGYSQQSLLTYCFRSRRGTVKL